MKEIRHLISVKEIYIVCGFNTWDGSITNFLSKKTKTKKETKKLERGQAFYFCDDTTLL